MKEKLRTKHVRRSQKDYSYSFKLQIVQEIEQGELSLAGAKRKYGIQGDATVRNWLQKFGNFDGTPETLMYIIKGKIVDAL